MSLRTNIATNAKRIAKLFRSPKATKEITKQDVRRVLDKLAATSGSVMNLPEAKAMVDALQSAHDLLVVRKGLRGTDDEVLRAMSSAAQEYANMFARRVALGEYPELYCKQIVLLLPITNNTTERLSKQRAKNIIYHLKKAHEEGHFDTPATEGALLSVLEELGKSTEHDYVLKEIDELRCSIKGSPPEELEPTTAPEKKSFFQRARQKAKKTFRKKPREKV